MDGVIRQRLHGEWRYKFLGGSCHDDTYVGAVILQSSDKVSAFVRSNSAGNTQQDPFVRKTIHNNSSMLIADSKRS
jgi:hypothetical protein